jgi:hypothetical protein
MANAYIMMAAGLFVVIAFFVYDSYIYRKENG